MRVQSDDNVETRGSFAARIVGCEDRWLKVPA
jgi:hypothetical protein